MKNAFLIVGFVIVIGLQMQALAHTVEIEDPELRAVVQKRHDYMTGLGKSMKAFSNYVKREVGDLEELAAMAGKISETAASIPDLFPTATGKDTIEGSEAKPEIWHSWEEFVGWTATLEERAVALQSAFDRGEKEQISDSVKALGKEGCRGCHRKYREKKD